MGSHYLPWHKNVYLCFTTSRHFLETGNQKPAKAPGFHSIIFHELCVNFEKFIHFIDNESLPEKYSRTARINSIFDYFASCFQKLFTTDWDISVDESLLLWKGRLSWKQYIWTKRSMFGLKSFVLRCKNLICLEFYFV